MKALPSRLASFAQHALRDTMGPWVAVSLSLHAALIAAVLPNRQDEGRPPTAGGAIAVDIVVVEGPGARAATATGATGDLAAKPDMALKEERRPVKDVAPDRTAAAMPKSRSSDNADANAAESTETEAQPLRRRVPTVTVKAPPSTSAPVILAPRPRPKPPPPVEPASRTAAADVPAGEPPRNADLDSGGEIADLAPAAPASAGGSRGASPEPGNPKPVYPYGARRQGAEGRVVLRVEVLPDGAAGAVTIDRSSGDERLDAAAAAAVRQWRFRPARRGGTPVAAHLRVPIRFHLR